MSQLMRECQIDIAGVVVESVLPFVGLCVARTLLINRGTVDRRAVGKGQIGLREA